MLAGLLYLLVMKVKPEKRLRTLFMMITIGLPLIIYIATSANVADLFHSRLGIQAYDTTRFSKQDEALDLVMYYPLGIGPGQTELVLNHSAHSLYVRLLVENGLIGFLSFIAFFLLCIYQLAKKILVNEGFERGLNVIIFASLIGILFNSFFIDTIHWRHFWLLLALLWYPSDREAGE